MKLFVNLFIVITLLSACTQQETVEEVKMMPEYEKAVAILSPVGDSGVNGVVHFQKAESGVQVTADITGLSEGNHGFHIHQYGDCTAEDGTSAGGHFNPLNKEHSNPESANRHMGDMGNIGANAEGMASIDYIDHEINISMILGRGVVLHGGEDDLSSQPSGAAGPRVGCGVIGLSN